MNFCKSIWQGTLLVILLSLFGFNLTNTARAATICVPGTINVCKACNASGTAWIDNSTKCAQKHLYVFYSDFTDWTLENQVPPDTAKIAVIRATLDKEKIMMETLQGIVNQSAPLIYINTANSDVDNWLGGYDRWLDNLKNYGYTYENNNDSGWYLDNFKAYLKGYILYNYSQNSQKVATSLSGLLDAVAIDPELETKAQAHGLSLLLDVRGKDEKWLRSSTYWSQLNHNELILWDQTVNNGWAWGIADYVAYKKLFMFYNGNSDFYRQIMADTNDNSPVSGWGSGQGEIGEVAHVTAASQANLYTTSLNSARDLSVLSQIQPTGGLHQSVHTDSMANFPKTGVHYATFVVSDGDNIAGMPLTYMNSKSWYGDRVRGQSKIGWEISPSMVQYAPTVLDWYYKNAQKDNFVAGVSGAGYIFTDQYPDMTSFSRITNDLMGQADQKIVTVLGTNPTFNQAQTCDQYTVQPNIDGVLAKYAPNYQIWGGQMVLSNGKPCVTNGENLYSGFGQTTKDQLVARINSSPTDPSISAGYTYVNVGPWPGGSTGDTAQNTAVSLGALTNDVINRLGPNVVVVNPEEFIKLISANVFKIFNFGGFKAKSYNADWQPSSSYDSRLIFNGQNSYAEFLDDPVFNRSNSVFFEIKTRIDNVPSAPGSALLAGKVGSYWAEIYPNSLCFWLNKQGTGPVATCVLLDGLIGAENSYQFLFDGTSLKIGINGIQKASKDIGQSSIVQNSNKLMIGGDHPSMAGYYGSFNGVVDDFSFAKTGTIGAASVCIANTVSGCKVCNTDGTAWVDDNSKCQSVQTCSSGTCVSICTPKTCSQLNYSCGNANDGCGAALNCGACASDQICANNNCVVNNCAPKTCASLGNYTCGSWPDGCGNTIDCGTCANEKTCSAGVCVASSSGGGGGDATANQPEIKTTEKPATQMTRAELLAAIARTQALIADLQKQLAALTGSTTTFSCSQITKNLFYGTKNDPQVKCLQEVLKSQGYGVAPTGDYGAVTKSAVAQFQTRYASEILAPFGLTRGSGNVGDSTRAKINLIIGEK